MSDIVEHVPDFDSADNPTIDELNAPREIPADTSLLDLLQEDIDDLASTEFVDIRIPGYEKTGLMVRYHLPDTGGKELDAIARQVQRETKDTYYRNLLTGIDTMIHLCVGLYVQPAGIPEPVKLDPDFSGTPVRFDQRLADSLKWEGVTTARQVVRRLFTSGGIVNEMAINSHAEKLNRWLGDTTADVKRNFWEIQGE